MPIYSVIFIHSLQKLDSEASIRVGSALSPNFAGLAFMKLACFWCFVLKTTSLWLMKLIAGGGLANFRSGIIRLTFFRWAALAVRLLRKVTSGRLSFSWTELRCSKRSAFKSLTVSTDDRCCWNSQAFCLWPSTRIEIDFCFVFVFARIRSLSECVLLKSSCSHSSMSSCYLDDFN